MFSLFSNTKNIIIVVVVTFFIGYIGKLKYDSYVTNKKYTILENKVLKQNIENTKHNEKVFNSADKIEKISKIKVLEDRLKSYEERDKEIIIIKDIFKEEIKKVSQKGVNVIGRTKGKPFRSAR